MEKTSRTHIYLCLFINEQRNSSELPLPLQLTVVTLTCKKQPV